MIAISFCLYISLFYLLCVLLERDANTFPSVTKPVHFERYLRCTLIFVLFAG